VTYYSNDVIIISGSFTDTDGDATDPTGLVLIVKPNGGTAVTYEYPEDITKDSVGEYSMEWTAPTVTRPTKYRCQWQPTGAVQRASVPSRFYISPLLR
jgi:hypothetical protein